MLIDVKGSFNVKVNSTLLCNHGRICIRQGRLVAPGLEALPEANEEASEVSV